MNKLILLLLLLMIGCTNFPNPFGPGKTGNKTTTSVTVDSTSVDSTNLDLTITLYQKMIRDTYSHVIPTKVFKGWEYGTVLLVEHLDGRFFHVKCFDGGVRAQGSKREYELLYYVLDSVDVTSLRDVTVSVAEGCE